MNIHLLGICGTFMGGLAAIAQQAGHTVSGSDTNIYPPMSTQLSALGIEVMPFDAVNLDTYDQVIVGNIMSRGHPLTEQLLNSSIPYTSGPQWLAEHILQDRWVLAVAGTHGKTTTSAMLAWILEHAGENPGFLIGGMPENFGLSARLGSGNYFVIEADEYDSAFFDKRSKFMHYHPKTLIINNLEFDHADIFPDLAAIQRQFSHLLATVPSQGQLICPMAETNLEPILTQAPWTPITRFGAPQGDWHAKPQRDDGSHFTVYQKNQAIGSVHWSLIGQHNIHNALAAIAAAHHAGVPPATATAALSQFKNVKRRLETKGQRDHITLYDDFAHHPTAIATVLAGLRANVGNQANIIVLLALTTFTLRTGWHDPSALTQALQHADGVLLLAPPSQGNNTKNPKNANPSFAQHCLSELQQTHAFAELVHTEKQLVQTLMQADGWLQQMGSQQPIHIVSMGTHGVGGVYEMLLSGVDS